MTWESAESIWPSATPPPALDGHSWELSDIAQLPHVRAQLRELLEPGAGPDLRDRIVLALDEMASNALRHGGGGVRARVQRTEEAWLVEVCDDAPTRPPEPAVGRDPSLGGLGLYLIAEMSDAHGWFLQASSKSVWALLPRR